MGFDADTRWNTEQTWHITNSDAANFCNTNKQEHELQKPRCLFLLLSHLGSQIDVNQATDLIRLTRFASRLLKQKVLRFICCLTFMEHAGNQLYLFCPKFSKEI